MLVLLHTGPPVTNLLNRLLRGEGDAQDRADDAAVLDDLVDGGAQHVDRHRKADAGAGARRGVDRRVNACTAP